MRDEGRTADPAERWEPGTRVRLDRPDNPAHPRRDESGEVIVATWVAAVHRYRWDRERQERVQVPVHPAAWTVRVRFGHPTMHTGTDWVLYDDWWLFGHELAREAGR